MDSQQHAIPNDDKHRAIGSENTMVEITNCATGEGHTLRRTRTSSHRELFKDFFGPDRNRDCSLSTPSLGRAASKPVGPPKVGRKSGRRSRSSRYSGDSLFSKMPEKEVEDILESSRQNISRLFQKFRKYVSEDTRMPRPTAEMNKACDVLGSPFQERPIALPSPESPLEEAPAFPSNDVAHDPQTTQESHSFPESGSS